MIRTTGFDVDYECFAKDRLLPVRKVMRLIHYFLINKGTWPDLL